MYKRQLLAVPLLFIPKRWMVWLQSALLVLWGIEWLRSAWELVLQRMAWGEPWMRAGAIAVSYTHLEVLARGDL